MTASDFFIGTSAPPADMPRQVEVWGSKGSACALLLAPSDEPVGRQVSAVRAYIETKRTPNVAFDPQAFLGSFKSLRRRRPWGDEEHMPPVAEGAFAGAARVLASLQRNDPRLAPPVVDGTRAGGLDLLWQWPGRFVLIIVPKKGSSKWYVRKGRDELKGFIDLDHPSEDLLNNLRR
ncbi:MAG: hypothetical protein ACYDBQ_11400 [Thermoplasmatota archaeon]